MKRSKALWILLLLGLLGTAAVAGFLVGTGALRSYEGTATYPLADVRSAAVYSHLAQVQAVPAQTNFHAEVYAKAWLPGPVDFDRIFSARIDGGALTVTETPFPAEFLGMFPQPYEMRITLYLPSGVCDTLEEVRR